VESATSAYALQNKRSHSSCYSWLAYGHVPVEHSASENLSQFKNPQQTTKSAPTAHLGAVEVGVDLPAALWELLGQTSLDHRAHGEGRVPALRPVVALFGIKSSLA
jgi:hypothetical protein